MLNDPLLDFITLRTDFILGAFIFERPPMNIVFAISSSSASKTSCHSGNFPMRLLKALRALLSEVC